MNAEEKAEIVVDFATRATIAALERYIEKNPGKGCIKPILFPNVSRRAAFLMESEHDPIFDDEAIAPPDDRFLHRHWKAVKFLAASKYKKYIIPETDGFRLGTLAEWCELTVKKDLPIVVGIGRSAAKRSKIAAMQGASSPLIDSKIKQLGSGEQTTAAD